MIDDDLDARFELASTLIEEAAALALERFQGLDGLTVDRKGAHDLATTADLEVEQLIRGRLTAAFPGDAFVGEETGSVDAEEGTGVWIVDPIDGTQPFVSGLSSWCVSIAYARDGTLELGFVASPARDEVFRGRRGHGATLNGRPIHVSDATSLGDGIVGLGYAPRVAPPAVLEPLARLIDAGGVYHRDGSGALGLCYVAAGRLLGFIEAHMYSWDAAGGMAVVQAAGGRINDILAGDGLMRGSPIIAAPPALYDVLEAILGDARKG